MKTFIKCITIVLCLLFLVACSQQNERMKLGHLQKGATVSFVRDISGEWGIEISNKSGLLMKQNKPAQIIIFQGEENVENLAAGYKSVQKEGNILTAEAKVADGSESAFDVEDQWTISGDDLTLIRKVNVNGTKDSAGFYSAIRLSTVPEVRWEDVDLLAPGLLYGKPHTSPGASGGSLNYNAKRFSIREDVMSAPLFGIRLPDGNWVAALNLSPDGATTLEETTALATTIIIDERIKLAAI